MEEFKIPSLEEMKVEAKKLRDSIESRVKFSMGISDEEIQSIVRSVLNGTYQKPKDYSKVNRLEIISAKNGREYTNHNIENVSISMQDYGRTMKLFINYKDVE
jgi:uncharacterized membrane protein